MNKNIQKCWRPAVFLDRDGVLNKDNGYAYRPDQIEWIDGVADALKLLKSNGYLLFVVTNQTGIARGLYKEEDVIALHMWMNKTLSKQGITIDDFRYSPYHPDFDDGRFRHVAHWRKPCAGMLMDLIYKWSIYTEESFLIGDRDTDIKAAKSAGIKGFLFSGTNLCTFVGDILKVKDGSAF